MDIVQPQQMEDCTSSMTTDMRGYDVTSSNIDSPKRKNKTKFTKRLKRHNDGSSPCPDDKPQGKELQEDDLVYLDIIRCQICGDKASGMHYGVYSCEGCKGFFRRTQRLQIEYKKCPYWGKMDGCEINIESRNKCQYCRYQKCLSLGMSSAAVRMGRVPKTEVKKLKHEMDTIVPKMKETDQKREHRLFVKSLEEEFVDTVLTLRDNDTETFWKRCSTPFMGYTPEGTYVINGMQLDMEGPPREITSRAEMAQQCFTSMEVAIQKFATFAKKRDDFRQLSSADQLTLFQGAALEVCACLNAARYYHGVHRFPEINTYVRKDVAVNSPFGEVTTFTTEMAFYERFNELGLTNAERAVFCYLLLYSPDREGLIDRAVVEQRQEHLANVFYCELKANHPHHKNLYAKVMDIVVLLRTLVPDHMDRLKQIKMRCNGHLPAEPGPLIREVYGNGVAVPPEGNEVSRFSVD